MRNLWIIVAIVIAMAAVWLVVIRNQSNDLPNLEYGSTTTPVSTSSNGTTDTADRHVSPDGLVFFRPNDFGLALNPQQVVATSVIPPCTDGFDYCLYYNGNTYEDTNFESAGVSINTLNATSSTACESSSGYNGQVQNERNETVGANEFFVFESSDAGAGHIAEDTVYQTFQNNTCFELVARIGVTQFANYETGTINEFTAGMRNEMRIKLENIISAMEFQS